MDQTLLHATDFAAATLEITSKGGRILQTFNNTLIAAVLPDSAPAATLQHASTTLPPSLDNSAKLAAAAWLLNRSDATRARAPAHTAGVRWDDPGFTAPKFFAEPGPALSNQMRGSIALGIVVVSGPGSYEIQDGEYQKILQEVNAGLDFLIGAKPSAALRFDQDLHFLTVGAAACSDPNGCNGNTELCEAPWRDPAMAQLGYAAGMDGVTKYVDDLRKAKVTSWAYVAYFTKYPLCHFAYASYNGPRLCMNYSNDGWGPNNIHSVFAHESGHIFGALDEYYVCSCGQKQGQLEVPNNNCVNCQGAVHLACLMDENTLSLCDYSKWAIGWSNRLLTDDEAIGPSGGTGGAPFEDPPLPEGARITKVRIRHGTRVDAIGISYTLPSGPVNPPLHGGTGGDLSELVLEHDEYVTGVSGRYGERVDSVIIHTNKRDSIPYGGSGGEVDFQYSITPNLDFAGFSGRSGTGLDALGLCLRLRSGAPSSTLKLMRMGPSGGDGGGSFGDDPLPTGARLAKVRIRHGTEIDAIGITYEVDGEFVDRPLHGGSGGTLDEFVIDADDYLIGISGRFGSRVDSLILQTSKGKVSIRYGGSGGSSDWSYVLSPRMEIVGFSGNCGTYVDALGPIFQYR